jgi:hypothetical protein
MSEKDIDTWGNEKWIKNGKLHREDGPALTYKDNTQEWWFKGRMHREGGPAIISPSGYNAWFKMGKKHREDGPAIIYSDGSKEYWLNNRRLSKEKWWEEISNEQKLNALFNGEDL